MKNFVIHLKDEVIQLKESLSNLDSEMVMHIACRLGGEVLTSAGLAALTGAGVAKLSMTLANAVLKLKGMSTLLSRLNQLKKIGQARLAHEVLSCAISN